MRLENSLLIWQQKETNTGKRKNILQTQAKKVSNAIFGYIIRGDIEEAHRRVSSHWMKTEYDDRVNKWFPLKSNNIMVKIADHIGVEDNGYGRKN